jgi:hypothetical protein
MALIESPRVTFEMGKRNVLHNFRITIGKWNLITCLYGIHDLISNYKYTCTHQLIDMVTPNQFISVDSYCPVMVVKPWTGDICLVYTISRRDAQSCQLLFSSPFEFNLT